MMLQTGRMLVTGGSGFIGSHLCDRLLADGAEVFCLDNLSSGAYENIVHLIGDPKFHFIKHDITEPYDLAVDAIFNLACPASPKSYQTDPIGTTRTCVLGAMNMLELAKRRNCRIFQASTSEVYGDPEVHPQHEDYCGNVNPNGPRACYDEGKRVAETLFFDYHRIHGVDIRVARLFNTYGPRMKANDGRVAPNLITQALAGAPMTIYGGGHQTRSFCYVDDLVTGILAMMSAGAEAAGPINLGASFEMTILELASLVKSLAGSGSTIVNMDLPQDDPQRRRPDIGRANAILGWAPQITPEEGMARTMAYFRDEKLKAISA